MLEIRKGDFANSPAKVAREVVGPKFSVEEFKKYRNFKNIPHIDDYTVALCKNLEKANQTREHDPSCPYFAMSNVIDLAKKRNAIAHSTSAVPWTVAIAILTNDSAIAKTSEINLHLMLDITLGFAANDCNERREQASRAAAYYKSPGDKDYAQKAAEDHRKSAEYFESLQNKLREPISISLPSQKK